jgi:signal transduction histidine kinase
MPNVGDELHHHGWNACSSALCPNNAHPHVERPYLLMMGLRSSRIHFVDVKDDPEHPKIAKVIEPEDYQQKIGYSRPHTAHCGPEGTHVTNLGSAFSDEGPGGIALLDHDTFEVIGQWEKDRGPQLENARLTTLARMRLDELRDSQQRVVVRSDAERRRIERDLHDGAQQGMVSGALHRAYPGTRRTGSSPDARRGRCTR